MGKCIFSDSKEANPDAHFVFEETFESLKSWKQK